MFCSAAPAATISSWGTMLSPCLGRAYQRHYHRRRERLVPLYLQPFRRDLLRPKSLASAAASASPSLFRASPCDDHEPPGLGRMVVRRPGRCLDHRLHV